MALNLLKARKSVIVHNRTRSREEPLLAFGARRAASPAEAAREAEFILTCVSDTPDVEQVFFAAGRGAIEGVRPGAVVIDCSTISPEATRKFAAAFRERGAGYVDAPVSGGSEGARNATLAIMCGGTEEDFARARPVLECLGRAITHVGPPGSGQIAKAVNQVVIAGTYLALAEGLALTKKAGAEPARVFAAIANGAARSWVLENRAGNMMKDEYPLGFRLRLHRKDLAIALDTARRAGASLPLAALVAATEDGLLAQGFGDEDLSALARAVRRASAIPDGPM
jgi:3-hydroxyisobutyrate dehydrogenase